MNFNDYQLKSMGRIVIMSKSYTGDEIQYAA